MIRRPVGAAWAARALLNRGARTPSPAWARFSSTGTRPETPISVGKESPTQWKRYLVLGAVASAAWLTYDQLRAPASASVPPIKNVTSEDLIRVESPVKILDLAAADAMLRREVGSFVFDSEDKTRGRVDVVRVSSNNPVEDEWDLAVARGLAGAKTVFYGVYDGHAGWATSKVLKGALVPYVSMALSKLPADTPPSLVDDAIKKAFVRLDDRITAKATDALNAGYAPGSAEVIAAIAPAIAGSCALLSIYDPQTSTLRTAVTGDSRAVRGAWSPTDNRYGADALSLDQTGFNKAEVARIDREHPGEKDDILSPASGRLLGLAVTRAFGDHRWKWPRDLIAATKDDFYGPSPRPKYLTPPYMSAQPEVTTRQVRGEDFVILASDGLWDMMSNDDAVVCVARWLAAKKAGRREPVAETKHIGGLEDGWRATPEHFVIEDLDSAAVCLVKNALGGSRRGLFLGAMSTYAPLSRNVRDDMTVQVVFFKDPYVNEA
ncbi:hypothetical protein QQZ08_009076 [Neonectria magnoliae]|uniref:PPM-type phosphatase domain-containing protein n=1 Tax=Neonectria magnoliae TaxID=2732573 RepID=A0ABR1HQF8_9HYPO